MQIMRALITGATGFIGSNLTRRLLGLGWKVNVLVRNKSNLGRISDIKGLDLYEGDLSNKKTLIQAAHKVDVIFNCAAALNYHKPSEKVFRKTNIDGLKNILDTAKKSRSLLVHLSTVGIYGHTDSSGADESSPVNPQDTYSRTKVEGEQLIEDYKERYGLKVVIVRPTIAYGPGDTRPGLLDLFKFVGRGLFIPLGLGNNYFHTVYVDNLIDALVLAATNKEAVDEDFIIGDAASPQMKDLYRVVYKISGKKMPSFFLPVALARLAGIIFDGLATIGFPRIFGTQRVRFLTENKRYRIDKARKVLGYKPKVGLKKGLERTYAWYRQNNYL